jgi:hypothetical protein
MNMSSEKLVTSAQVESLRTMAIAKGISRKTFQEWLDTQAPNILTGLKETVRIGKIVICRHVIVNNRAKLPYDIFKATKHHIIACDDVFKAMPIGNGTEVDVLFFKIGRNVSDIELDEEYEIRGLVPADPYTLAKVNEDDCTFADEYPHCTHWKNENDKWCFAVFSYNRGCRIVNIDQNICSGDYCSSFWFAGLRKPC